MAQTIHDLFREIDKALEQVRAVGKATNGEPGAFPFTPGGLAGFHAETTIIVDDPEVPDTIDPAATKEMFRTMPDLALEMRYGERSRCVISPDQFVYADGRPLSDADKRRLFGEPRRSIIAAMHSARRARARKRKPITADDASVHNAISAMQKPGRANEL